MNPHISKMTSFYDEVREKCLCLRSLGSIWVVLHSPKEKLCLEYNAEYKMYTFSKNNVIQETFRASLPVTTSHTSTSHTLKSQQVMDLCGTIQEFIDDETETKFYWGNCCMHQRVGFCQLTFGKNRCSWDIQTPLDLDKWYQDVLLELRSIFREDRVRESESDTEIEED